MLKVNSANKEFALATKTIIGSVHKKYLFVATFYTKAVPPTGGATGAVCPGPPV